jgi:hypothetical protein
MSNAATKWGDALAAWEARKAAERARQVYEMAKAEAKRLAKLADAETLAALVAAENEEKVRR